MVTIKLEIMIGHSYHTIKRVNKIPAISESDSHRAGFGSRLVPDGLQPANQVTLARGIRLLSVWRWALPWCRLWVSWPHTLSECPDLSSARTLLTSGSQNTLPLEIFGMTTNVTTPVLYALGTLTTGFSFLVIGLFLFVVWLVDDKRRKRGSDAGKGMA